MNRPGDHRLRTARTVSGFCAICCCGYASRAQRSRAAAMDLAGTEHPEGHA